jgi:magnesium transporter
MHKFIRTVTRELDLPSGEMVHLGEKKIEDYKITVIDYDEGQFQEKEIKSIEEYIPYEKNPTVTWVNVDGINNVEVIEKIGKHFNLHDLTMEDILNTGQHPMIEDFGDYLFLILKMIYCDGKDSNIIVEHISLLIGQNFVISLQEGREDVFDPLRKRIRLGKGRIRKMGAGYLAYALIDAIVDNYFAVLHKIGEEIEFLEEEIINTPSADTLRQVYNLKRELLFLRKSIWPLREVISCLSREESLLIKEAAGIYLRDVYDNLIQVIDTIETFRDILCGILEIYMSSNSNKMNEVVKVLTIISTIFIPLSFIASIYGMNILMPEKDYPWTYPVVIVVMLLIGISMVIHFRKKKWL